MITRHLSSTPRPRIITSLPVSIFFLLIIFTIPSLAEESCGPLIGSKCLSCHFETRICQKMKKKKGKGSWKRTIKAMIRHGTELSKGEQKLLVQCFAERDPSVLSLCGFDR